MYFGIEYNKVFDTLALTIVLTLTAYAISNRYRKWYQMGKLARWNINLIIMHKYFLEKYIL